MSVYSCETCSFYTNRNTKLIAHLQTQKHKENSEMRQKNTTSLTCGQKKMNHRTLKTQTETTKIIPQPPTSSKNPPQQPLQSVFTLLEIKDNQVVSTRQVDVNNSIINFI